MASSRNMRVSGRRSFWPLKSHFVLCMFCSKDIAAYACFQRVSKELCYIDFSHLWVV